MKKIQDHYFKKAKEENYPARSIYKLQEMDDKYRLFKKGEKVLDLGASPGSWTLYAAQRVGAEGKVLALDLNPPATQFPSQVLYLQENVYELSEDFLKIQSEIGFFDVVMSDMAPKTTGIKSTDQARSFALAEQALYLAQQWLKPGGCFTVKIFQGGEYQAYTKKMREVFAEVKTFKPKSSRAESKEIFLVGLKKK